MAESVMTLGNNDDLKLKAEQLIDEAYIRGHDDGKKKSTLHCWTTKEIEACEEIKSKAYQSGLNDAWECARKILDMGDKELECIFGTKFFDGNKIPILPIDVFSAQNAMKRIKDYERKQKWAEQAKRGKEHRDKIEKMLEKRQTEKNCHTCALNYRFCEINRCKDGNNRLFWQPKQEEQQDEDKPKCDTCEFESSQFNPCNGCVDNDEYAPKQTEDNYVDAIVKVRVPKWQIGEKVNLYFKDTMSMDGICEADKK